MSTNMERSGSRQDTVLDIGMSAILAIKGALRIKDCWLCPSGHFDDQYNFETDAVTAMYRAFKEIADRAYKQEQEVS